MSEPILQINHLSKTFGNHEVLRDIDFSVNPGDVTSIIGASGSGKSTLLRCINLLETPTSGEILYHGTNIDNIKGGASAYRSHVGMVFQSFNLFNNMTALKNCMIGQTKVLKKSRAEAKASALHYLEKVGMAPYINAKPSQLSGGQKQRVAIARALAMEPKFIVCDEPVSALDVSIQAQILNLLKELQAEFNLSYIFITHDLSVVNHFSDEIAVMYLGKIVEKAPAEQLFDNPLHPYTKALLSAIPIPELGAKKERILIQGEITSPINPPDECRFYKRCNYACDRCKALPELKEIAPDHFVACHLVGEI